MKIKVKQIVIYLFTLSLVLFSEKNKGVETAFVIKSVIDLTGSPLKTKKSTAKEQHNQCALMGSKNPSHHCHRLQQLLLNERVELIKTVNDEEVLVNTPQLFWINSTNQQKMNSLCTLKQNLITETELKNKGLNSELLNNPSCTLSRSYQDPLLNISYSAGTSFTISAVRNDTYLVYTLDPHDRTIKQTFIPKYLCTTNQESTSFQEKKSNMVALAHEWAHDSGWIPYVWGGSSYQVRYNTPSVRVEESGIAWYEGEKSGEVYDGIDCSSLIYRLAYISGIRFPYKNSSTMKAYLPTLQEDEQLEEGDIFIYKGHVALIGNLENNTLIEARGHDSGYGKVHEISLNDYFLNIKTFDELIRACREKRPLTVLKKGKEPEKTVTGYGFLRLVEVGDK